MGELHEMVCLLLQPQEDNREKEKRGLEKQHKSSIKPELQRNAGKSGESKE